MNKKLTLKCYGFQTSSGKWQGVCLKFNLATEADNFDHLKKKMDEIIYTYIESVLDTTDKSSILKLLSRRAPLRDYFYYYSIKLINEIREIPTKIIFQQTASVPA